MNEFENNNYTVPATPQINNAAQANNATQAAVNMNYYSQSVNAYRPQYTQPTAQQSTASPVQPMIQQPTTRPVQPMAQQPIARPVQSQQLQQAAVPPMQPPTPPVQPSTMSQQPPEKPVKPPKKKNNFMFKALGAIAIGIIFGVCAALGFYAVNRVTNSASQNTTYEVSELQDQIDELKASLQSGTTTDSSSTSVVTQTTGSAQTQVVTTTVSTDVTDVVEKVMPSMVSITNIYEETTSYWGHTYTSEAQASGSGIIIGENDKEYLIVTNYHVIEKCVSLSVQFADMESADANVKGYDESMDIAVISVQKDAVSADTKKAIAIAEIGDSDALKIGEPAIAIGNALGYGQSVTTGVISALDRNIEMENSYDKLIQTSAAINPGNSGGALLNINGQVIGINSSKIGGSTIEGMGYAIPVNAIKELVEELSSRETLYKVDENQRGYLGIKGQTVDDTTSETYGIPAGVYVTDVYANSAAEEAGIMTGDVITNVNGQSVSTISELQEALSYFKGGDTVTLRIQRASFGGYTEMELQVTLSTKNVFNVD